MDNTQEATLLSVSDFKKKRKELVRLFKIEVRKIEEFARKHGYRGVYKNGKQYQTNVRIKGYLVYLEFSAGKVYLTYTNRKMVFVIRYLDTETLSGLISGLLLILEDIVDFSRRRKIEVDGHISASRDTATIIETKVTSVQIK